MSKSLEPPTLRMQFELDRMDDPDLYDDLIRFPKGTKRLNRLRRFATLGFVLSRLKVAPEPSGERRLSGLYDEFDGTPKGDYLPEADLNNF